MPFRNLGFLPQTEPTEIKCGKEIFKIQCVRLRRHRQGAARFFHEAETQRLWPVQIGFLPPLQDARLRLRKLGGTDDELALAVTIDRGCGRQKVP
jgi:hypothetical protein